VDKSRKEQVENVAEKTIIGRRDSGSFKAILLIILVLFLVWFAFDWKGGQVVISPCVLNNFSTIFISLILEALPFVLLGVLISSLIQIYITEDMLVRFIPRQKLPALFAASLSGLFFPICECANVPVARRLIAKGVPLYVGMTFLMSVAIMNPVVLLSTYYAFGGNWQLALIRGFLGMLGAIIIGFAVSLIKNPAQMLRPFSGEMSCGCEIEHDHEHDPEHCKSANDLPECGCGFEHTHKPEEGPGCCSGSNRVNDREDGLKKNILQKENLPGSLFPRRGNTAGSLALKMADEYDHARPADSKLSRLYKQAPRIIEHTSAELYSVGRFFIMGAFIASFVQTFLPRQIILTVGEHPVLSVLALMALAYGLSLCSEADAFIARTFVGQFTSGAIMAFMIFGPMIDIKNTLMLSEGFVARFVTFLIIITAAVSLGFAMIINLAGW
jgi:uncharacterized protein